MTRAAAGTGPRPVTGPPVPRPRPRRLPPFALVLGVAAYLWLVHAPLLGLAWETGRSLAQHPELLAKALPTERRLPLLGRSLALSLGAAVAAGTIAVLAAPRFWRRHPARLARWRWLVLGLAPVPAYVHALAWLPVRTALEARLGPDWATPLAWLGSCWVLAMAFLPLALLVTLVALESVPRPLTDAAAVLDDDDRAYRRVLLPLAAPLLLVGLALIFLLGLLDYSVPTLYQLNVYAMEVFVAFSQGNEAASAVLVALPLLLLGALLTLTLGRRAARIAAAAGARARPAARPLRWGRLLGALQLLAATLVLLQAAVLLFSLLRLTGSPRQALESLRVGGADAAYSLAVAALAGGLALPPALAAALWLQNARGGWSSRLRWTLAVLPLGLPPALVGIGLIAVYNQPPLRLHGTDAMPVLAAMARFLPLQALLVYGQLQRQDPGLVDAARIYQPSPLAGWLRIRLPLLLPGLAGAAALGFALALGELGATLVVTPAGRGTLTLRIYNYLHYGASDAVAALCLAMVGLALLAGAAAGLLLGRGGWLPGEAEA